MSAVPGEFRSDRIGAGAASLALLASLLWGGNQVFIKIGLVGMPPLAMAAARFGVGLLIVAGAAVATGVAVRVHAGEWRRLLGLAALFVLQIALLNEGTHYTTASRSTVLISAHPFFTALFCHFFVPGDRLNLAKTGGMTLAFAAIVIIFTEGLAFGDLSYLAGDIMILASAVLLGLRQMVLKRLVHGFHPFKILYWQALLSLPVFAVLSLSFESEAAYHLTLPVLGAVLYQGVVVAGFCFVLWIFLLQRYSASRLGVFGFATPILGVLLSVLLVGDTLSPMLMAGTVLAAVGIGIGSRS